jgi:hypothetical protein
MHIIKAGCSVPVATGKNNFLPVRPESGSDFTSSRRRVDVLVSQLGRSENLNSVGSSYFSPN